MNRQKIDPGFLGCTVGSWAGQEATLYVVESGGGRNFHLLASSKQVKFQKKGLSSWSVECALDRVKPHGPKEQQVFRPVWPFNRDVMKRNVMKESNEESNEMERIEISLFNNHPFCVASLSIDTWNHHACLTWLEMCIFVLWFICSAFWMSLLDQASNWKKSLEANIQKDKKTIFELKNDNF